MLLHAEVVDGPVVGGPELLNKIQALHLLSTPRAFIITVHIN